MKKTMNKKSILA